MKKQDDVAKTAEQQKQAPEPARHGRAQEAHEKRDDLVHEASEESFPASDPPSFTPNTSIGPADGTGSDKGADTGAGRKGQ